MVNYYYTKHFMPKTGGICMTYGEMTKILSEKFNVSYTDFISISTAVSQVFPMIVLVNLTKNTYTMLCDEGFLYHTSPVTGCYDDLIDDSMENIHPNYQQHFYECFSREHLIQTFIRGKRKVYAEIYQKDKNRQYHWVSVDVFRIENESGDMMHICFNRVLEGRHG